MEVGMKWKMVLCAGLLAFLAAGCSALGQGNAPLPTVVLDAPAASEQTTPAAPRSSGGLTVSGEIAAAHEINVSPASAGVLVEMLVQEGEQVQAGQTLARLSGSERLAAAVQGARFELLAARQARAALDDDLEVLRANAQLRLAKANQALDDAQKKRTWRNYRNGSDSLIAAGQADLILAKDALEKAQDVYDSVSSLDDFSVTKAGALSGLAAAQRAYDRAVGNLNYLTAMPDELEVARVEAELQAAQAEVDSASAALEKLDAGADAETIALADARIASVEAALTAAQSALAELEIKAPANGTVAAVFSDAGEWAQPGQPLLTLVDLTRLNARTTDLSERDVTQISLGQPARVDVQALGETIAGTVTRISPLADTLGGDVIYTVTLTLKETPAHLLPGMSVDIVFDAVK
jgi:multidrug resistance efflux pump